MNPIFNNQIARGALIGLACGALALLAGCSANSNGIAGSNNGGNNGGATIPLTANPSAIPVGTGGGTTTVNLTWNRPAASSCTLTDPNGKPVAIPSPTNSGNVPVTVNTSTTATFTYTLSCSTGAVAMPPQTATVSIYNPATDSPLAAYPNPVTQGSNTTLIWNHPNAASCNLTGTAPDGSPVNISTGTAGTPPGTAGTVPTPALTETGNYAFELVCKDSSGATVNDDKVTVAVNPTPTSPSATNQCNLADGTANSTPVVNLPAPATATITETALASALCLSCSVTPGTNAVDSDLTNADTISINLGLVNATETLTVAGPTTYTGTGTVGARAGFIISYPAGTLSAGVLQTLTVSTLLNGTTATPAQSVVGTAGGSVKLQLLGLVGGSNQAYAVINTTTDGAATSAFAPYNQIAIALGGLASATNSLQVNYACVAGPAP